jgi:4-hydroxyphenylacetate 3-monooxygenase
MTGPAGTAVAVELTDVARGGPVSLSAKRLVIAGYTGRDRSQVQRHIHELARQGVPAPETVPAYYDLSPALLQLDGEIAVAGPETSGEAEPVLFCAADGWYVGIGSDHTARDVERESVPASKASCPKPVSREVLPFDAIAERWDRLTLRSSSDGHAYQEGSLTELLPPRELVAGWERVTGEPTTGLVLFCGTVPLLSGRFHYGETFTAELADGDRTLLACTYRITMEG